MAVIYGLLVLGALTTVYPFLLMASTGFKSSLDQNDNKLVPEFWQDNAILEQKYMLDKYAGDQSVIDAVAASPAPESAKPAEYEAFLNELPPTMWHAAFRTAPSQSTGKLAMRYQAWLRTQFPSIDALNLAYIDENVAFQSVVPPTESFDRPNWKPRAGRKWEDWLRFKATLPAEYRVPVRAERMWQTYVKASVQGNFAAVPSELKGDAASFDSLRLPSNGSWRAKFDKEYLPVQFRDGNTVEELWAARTAGPLPLAAFDQSFVTENRGSIRQELTWRNYRFVLDYIAINGRALWNTALFCILSILTQLIVNPIAAYVLSRYRLPTTGQILVFLLATMAFPAEVAMIPNFLLLKEIGLLNTFAALVLPGAASGYMIFLLKGFFDALPQEIFESGQLDGAHESVMMWKLAFPLSRPVLGYLALLAFMGAYGAFMFAFLVVQDRSMWTLMVFLYQLQNTAPRAVMMAALTLAAIPTIVVFLASQRVIMRGIVLPGER